MKNLLFTTLALIAFAGNSILCRYALSGDVIDAASFTSIRLFSGALFVLALVGLKDRAMPDWRAGNWLSAFYLFLYALTFSYAYLTLNAGIGALILFGAVQVTMVLISMLRGKMLSMLEWGGLLIAFSGLSYLLLPSEHASTLSAGGFVLMVISGIAWGIYTVAGKGAEDPLGQTGGNFLRSLVFVLVLLLITIDTTNISLDGVLLAIISGAITSGLGYALWYIALRGLSVTQASIVQLSVPVIATFAGIVFLSETLTTQIIISTLLVIGGILMSALAKQKD